MLSLRDSIDNHRFFNRINSQQLMLDLSCFNAIAFDFDLMIHASKIYQIFTIKAYCQITSTIHPHPLKEWITHKALLGQLRSAQITPCHTVA
ncbi:hypothetical protein D3C77_300660 [compost metagenome]